MVHHLIFEGAELSGKSWLMSQIYNFLEPKYNQSGFILDGCHWFNCDVGVYGGNNSKNFVQTYIKVFEQVKERNLIIEKFHLSDLVYQKLHQKKRNKL